MLIRAFPTSRFPRYTTFRPEERKRLGLDVAGNPTPHQQRPGSPLKSHRFGVTYPDGTSGECRYERLGPAWHRFRFIYRDGNTLFVLNRLRPLPPGGAPAVEEVGKELAAKAFADAIERERRDYFCRATAPKDGSRKANPERFRLSVGLARAFAGRYALCVPIGSSLSSLVPVSKSHDTLEQANQEWRERGDHRLVVGCCNRLDRCWDLPRYNPLYQEFDPREQTDPSKGEPEETAP